MRTLKSIYEEILKEFPMAGVVPSMTPQQQQAHQSSIQQGIGRGFTVVITDQSGQQTQQHFADNQFALAKQAMDNAFNSGLKATMI